MSAPVFLSVPEAAAILRVSRTTIDRSIAKGRYPNVVKVGASWRIPASDLGITDDQARAYLERAEALNA